MKLFEPGKIGELTIKNRIFMAPMGMGNLADPDGRFSQRLIDHYVARAKGGTGLIITGCCFVSRSLEKAQKSLDTIVNDDVHIGRLNELAEAVHDYGAKLAIQLTAGFGRVAFLNHSHPEQPIAPSEVSHFYNLSTDTRSLTIEEIEQLISDFELAAKLVKIAGVDAIELHAHEGYLFDQFQTELWNKREDKYGGSFENRMRFSLEVIKSIKKGAGLDFPIIYRFGLTHYLDEGRQIDEGLEIARSVEAAGVDAIEVDAGCYENAYWPHPTSYQPQGLMVELAEMAKQAVKIPVAAIGKLNYPDLAERILEDGKADFIVLGRALLADPEWPNKVKTGNFEDIRPCIGDNEGCWSRLIQGRYTSCTVNPQAGMDRDFKLNQAERRKSILVIGGGPAGMEAARVAAIRGHEVVLWEKSNTLGGNLIPASVPDFKKDIRDLIKYLIKQIEKLGVTIELGREATPELILEKDYEVVFLATGADPIIPEIPGIEKNKVVTAIDALLNRNNTGDYIVIVGGGMIGCETALYLSQITKKVTIIEILEDIAKEMINPNRIFLLKMLEEAGVEILTKTSVSGITDGGITILKNMGEMKELVADTVVVSCGMESHGNKLQTAIQDRVPELYTIGDCVEPRKIINAIWEGFRIARLI